MSTVGQWLAMCEDADMFRGRTWESEPPDADDEAFWRAHGEDIAQQEADADAELGA